MNGKAKPNSCVYYSYTTVPEVIRENIDEKLFNYIRSNFIRLVNAEKEIVSTTRKMKKLKDEWIEAIKTSLGGGSITLDKGEIISDVSEVNRRFEARHKYYSDRIEMFKELHDDIVFQSDEELTKHGFYDENLNLKIENEQFRWFIISGEISLPEDNKN